ncbi:MAG: ISNCY family transposase [Lentisphaerae bacterium]|nr:ISNCY family transposase [Lentisphaerota bacterium]
MRKFIPSEIESGEISIPEIEFDLHSRDEIPKVLIGLQHIYSDTEAREEAFDILKDIIPEGTDMNNGRPGMFMWRILVLGTLKLNCDWNYDNLKEIADNHGRIREMLGHLTGDDYVYPLQTLKDNLSLFTPEVLDRVNQVVVTEAHKVVGKKDGDDLKGKCDSSVTKTDVHFPTDIHLLFDAVRSAIRLIAILCSALGITEWRQHHKNIMAIKDMFRTVRNLKRSVSGNEKKKAEKEETINEAHRKYVEIVMSFIDKVKETITKLRLTGYADEKKLSEIEDFVKDAEMLADQILRRVLGDEKIPHSEKIFSVFERHTEWIVKGKAGVPQELGKNVCFVTDQFGFILHHRIYENETDDKIAVQIVEQTQERFPDFNSCSFDKGFYSPENKVKLKGMLAGVILPKKGKLSGKEKDEENSEEFREGRRKHSVVESSISALKNHGLERCPDHGIEGFMRYVGLAVLARNIQILGHIIQKKKLRSRKRREKYNSTLEAKKQCAAA